MLATFVIEFGLAFYTLWRYKMTAISRIAVVMLFALGSFQLAEYMTCGGLGLNHTEWARFGYIAITLLPALGIHMLTELAGKKKPLLVGAAYATCAAFVTYYLINSGAISGQQCYANYAVFNTHSTVAQLFGAYYYGWLMVGIYLAWQWGNELPKRRKILRSMILGYLVFIVPTVFFNLVNPSTVKGIPSIMCGFAVLFALLLSIKVLPSGCPARAQLPVSSKTAKQKI
jgi:hypothetical protein